MARSGMIKAQFANLLSANSPSSLLLGGYDVSRFQANTSLKFNVNYDAVKPKKFSINLNYIKTVDKQSSNTTRMDLNYTSFVLDPITPYIWLPVDILTQLEKTMGLQYDTTSQLYLLPPTPVRIPDLYLGIWSAGNSSTYKPPGAAATDFKPGSIPDQRLLLTQQTLILNASYPLYNGTTNNTNSRQYIPFKRGPYPANGEYTLGRAFFQSVHIIANYEMEGFSLAQARYDPTESRAPTGLSPDSLGPVTNDPTGKAVGYPYYGAENSNRLTVILVAVLCTDGALAMIASIYGCCAYRKAIWPFKRQKNEDGDGDVLRTAKAELHGTTSSSANDKGLSITSTEISALSEMESSAIPVEMRGSPIVKAELDGDMPSYELDARPKSIDWGNKEADPSVIVRRLLAR